LVAEAIPKLVIKTFILCLNIACLKYIKYHPIRNPAKTITNSTDINILPFTFLFLFINLI